MQTLNNHPYIVAYRDSFNDHDLLCIAMEYCDGNLASAFVDGRSRRLRAWKKEQGGCCHHGQDRL